MSSAPNANGALPTPTEYKDVTAPKNLLAFTPFPYTMFSKDGSTRVVIKSSGFLQVSEDVDVSGPPMIVDGAEFAIGMRDTTGAQSLLCGTVETMATLESNPTADIIVVAVAAPLIPETHLGAVYTIPARPRVYESTTPRGPRVDGVDGVDLYRPRFGV